MLRKFLFISLLVLSLGVKAEETNVSPTPAAWQSIKHIVIVVLENQPAKLAKKQPYMKSLREKGAYLANFFAITHPSQPNYIAMTVGSQSGVTNNKLVTLDTTHIGTLLDAKGLTWKVYAEDLPEPCFTGAKKGYYARRHVPFLSFKNVITDKDQCQRVVEAEEFFKDIASNQLPSYAFYVPNNHNNGHDTGIAYSDGYLQVKFSSIFSNPEYLKDTLFVVTFDEDDGGHDNNVYAVLLGAGVKVGAKSNKKYDLYSLLRTVEDIYKLGTLGRKDAKAKVIDDVWLD